MTCQIRVRIPGLGSPAEGPGLSSHSRGYDRQQPRPHVPLSLARALSLQAPPGQRIPALSVSGLEGLSVVGKHNAFLDRWRWGRLSKGRGSEQGHSQARPPRTKFRDPRTGGPGSGLPSVSSGLSTTNARVAPSPGSMSQLPGCSQPEVLTYTNRESGHVAG